MFQYKNNKPMTGFQLKNVKVENKFTFFKQSIYLLLYFSCKGNRNRFPFRKTSINSSSKMCARRRY